MFNKENVDFLSMIHKQEENHAEIVKQFGQMGKTISEIKDSFGKSTSEIVILQPFEQTFAANGYRCNSIFVSDAAAADNVKLIVSLNAVTWTTNLAAGENVVNIPNQATFKATTTSGFPPSVILTRYNVPGIDNNVTVTNTPSVTLAGSNSVKITDGVNTGVVTAGGDNQTWAMGSISLSRKQSFNGASFDLDRNNTQGTLLASAARTATTQTTTQTNYNAKGVLITINVSVASGTGGLTPYLQLVDPVTGAYIAATTGIASPLTATGTYFFEFYPGIQTSGLGSAFKQSISLALPRTWQLQIYHSDATSYSYSVGYSLIL